MSLNDIVLPQSVIAEIYKNNLVEMTGEKKANLLNTAGSTEKNVVPLQYLGKNLKNILVFVNYPDDVFLPEKELEFLSKILVACKLDIGDIAIINTAKQPLNSIEYINGLYPKSIIVFGESLTNIVTYSDTGFFIPVYVKEIEVMTAPELEKFSMPTVESKHLKSKLWLSLQQFFKL